MSPARRIAITALVLLGVATGCSNAVTGQARAIPTEQPGTSETQPVVPGSIALFEPCELSDEALTKAGVRKSTGIPNSTAHGINCVWTGDAITLLVSSQAGSLTANGEDPSTNPQATHVQVVTDAIRKSWVFVFVNKRSSVCLGETDTADGIVTVSVIEHPPLPIDPGCKLVVDMMNLLSPYLPK